MAASADEICSIAMVLLGHTPFATFSGTDDVKHKAAEQVWPTVRDRVLARGAWNSCIKQVALSTAHGTAPLFDYARRFAMPADWLRTLSIGYRARWSPEYELIGGFVHTNAASVPLRYVFRNTVASTYEATLTDLLVQAMMARLAATVTGSTSRAEYEQVNYEQMLNTALALDGVEDDGPTLGNNSPLLESRFE